MTAGRRRPARPEWLPALPPRAADAHKGDFGRVVILGGSRGMSGAVALSGMAALRSGVGLVQLAVPDGCLDTVAAFEPSYMTTALEEDAQGRLANSPANHARIEALFSTATAFACGPGLGRSDALDQLIGWLYREAPIPGVFDADALNALSQHSSTLATAAAARVLTPHPGEFARLTGKAAPRDAASRRDAALEAARRWNAIVVLKGHHTCVADASEVVENPSGNPGMATGGTGDVLTGVVAGLLAQGMEPLAAAQLAVWVHGTAGDLAAEEKGEISLIASDLIGQLPAALRRAS